MRFDESTDSVLRICALLSVIASAMIVISMQQGVPDTMLNAVIDAVRFVLIVGVAIGAVIVMIERRAQAGECAVPHDADLVIDLGDVDLREHDTSGARPTAAPAARSTR